MKRLILFASGTGTNAENIINYFNTGEQARVTHVFSNNSSAPVLRKAFENNVKALHFDRESFYKTNDVLHILKDANPDLIILAGFLWKFPENIVNMFPNKIINIHPSLLPKYGGKGMYGSHVHKAVVENEEKETGITIHYIDEEYDQGSIIFQARIPVEAEDTYKEVAKKVQQLEHKHFPRIIEKELLSHSIV